jgi:hypothetical protein
MNKFNKLLVKECHFLRSMYRAGTLDILYTHMSTKNIAVSFVPSEPYYYEYISIYGSLINSRVVILLSGEI